ncbi:MAG: glycosyl transferase [Pleurocapsa sp.]
MQLLNKISQSNRQFVYAKLPRAGLGNMLLVWSKAVVFAKLNSLPLIAPAWGKITIGPYLRRERYARYYGNFFNDGSCISGLQASFLKIAAKKIYEPDITQLPATQRNGMEIYVFDQVPHWSNYFGDIREYHSLIKEALINNIKPHILQEIEQRSMPQIAIHVRMSDFRKLRSGENFNQVGLVRTPINWYIEVLKKIRAIAGHNIPTTVVSDGYDEELSELLQLPQVFRSSSASALSDLLFLAKSKLLITSAGSTFSSWASYLGRCPTICHPAHFHSGVFSPEISQTIFEGGLNPKHKEIPDLLQSNIVSLFKEKAKL